MSVAGQRVSNPTPDKNRLRNRILHPILGTSLSTKRRRVFQARQMSGPFAFHHANSVRLRSGTDCDDSDAFR
jgi:hypothetical protein